MTELAFTGDIAFSKHFKDAWADEQLIAPELTDFLRSADYVIPNVEGALTGGTTQRGDASVPAHASDPRSVDRLLKMGGNLWNLSNNHTLDCGEEGLADTLRLAAENSCRTFGAGHNVAEAGAPVFWEELYFFT